MRAPKPPRVRNSDPVAPRPQKAPALPEIPTAPAAAPPAVRRPTRDVTPRTPDVAVSMTPRLEERRRAENRALYRKLGIVAGCLIVVAALAWGVFFSPVFALHGDEVTVTIRGEGVDKTAVNELAAEYVGVPLPRIRTSMIERRVSEITAVLAADVTRQWPHGLLLEVTARDPIAAVPSEGGFELYDSDGVGLRWAEEAPEGLTVVTTEVGEDTGRTINAVLSVLGAIPDDLREEIATMSATSEETITFTLHDGATVKWGDASESDLKAAVLQTLRQANASTYDVSVPRTPVTS